MSVAAWSWVFLAAYLVGMLVLGLVGQRRVRHADDFATARSSYGPGVLALAFAATTASGATFLGGPGLAHDYGLPVLWSSVLYPLGVYLGVLVCMRLVATSGHRFGNRSIPEYLGDRYRSDGIRVLVSLYSLVLVFHIAGQLVAGLVMFGTLLGLPPLGALAITGGVLLAYVVLGGAHADILSDAAQGLLMLLLAVTVAVLVAVGAGVAGGFPGVVRRLQELDPDLVGWVNPSSPIYGSAWAVVAILIAHSPMGLLPHLGNKLWALKDPRQRLRFVGLAGAAGLTLGLLLSGGLLARAVLGNALFEPGLSSNQALPALFQELFPAPLAALVGVGILAAVMSTADGLLVSSSQVIANDLYRRTLVPRLRTPPDPEVLDRRVLALSRWSTLLVLLGCMALAWGFTHYNIALLIWAGIGGLMAAFAGPLLVGALWRRVTRAGAWAGLLVGMGTFVTLHLQWLDPAWIPGGAGHAVLAWLHGEGPNPISCAALGELASVLATVAVSLVTRPLPADHLEALFGPDRSAGPPVRRSPPGDSPAG